MLPNGMRIAVSRNTFRIWRLSYARVTSAVGASDGNVDAGDGTDSVGVRIATADVRAITNSPVDVHLEPGAARGVVEPVTPHFELVAVGGAFDFHMTDPLGVVAVVLPA
jgi:hypothetical protein